MKKTRFLSLLVLMVILGGVLSACTGGAGVVSSFPGILVDQASETAYLASGAHVYAVNLANGTERWRYPDKPASGVTFYGAPALTEDGQLIQGSFDHKLYGLNQGTHLPNWTFTSATDVYVAQPLVVGSTVYAPNSDKSIYAVDQSGALVWKAQATHAMWSTPVTDGTLIYAGSMDHHVYAFKQESGSQVWKSEDLGGALAGKLALSPEGLMYIGTLGSKQDSPQASKMTAINAASGKTVWQTPAKGWVWATPLIASDLVIFSDLEGYIYAVDGASGAVKWQVQPDTGTNREITAAPVVVENTLYVASQAGVLYALDLGTGAVSWSKTIGGKIYSDLVLAGDHILIAPMEFTSSLVSVDLQGNVSWNYTPAK